MFGRLFLIFTIVPLLEVALLIELGGIIGAANTVALIILTGLAGAALARSQGFGVLQRIQTEMSNGRLPGDSLLDGLLILAGGLLLLTPGLLTDTLGFFLLIPWSRRPLKAKLIHYFKTKMDAPARSRYTADN